MSGRTVLMAGATGLVGRELLAGLLADAAVTQVLSLSRRRASVEHPKLVQHLVDYAALPALPPVDEVYLALGTTIRVAGSQQAFRAVDFDANLAVARAARAAGATRAGLVSAMGASVGSAVFYSRVKGELEQALAGLGFEGLVIVRPSLLVGDRTSLGQPSRFGERLGFVVGRTLGALVPADYRPIAAARVAAALRTEVPRARGVQVLLSGALQRAAA